VGELLDGGEVGVGGGPVGAEEAVVDSAIDIAEPIYAITTSFLHPAMRVGSIGTLRWVLAAGGRIAPKPLK
jgi:hypothetical protein